MQPLQVCIGPIIRIGQESWCLPYAGFFETGPGCPIFQLYLESGHIPARFAIKRMTIIFFRYILSQEENSLIYRFLIAQKNDFKRGDW